MSIRGLRIAPFLRYGDLLAENCKVLVDSIWFTPCIIDELTVLILIVMTSESHSMSLSLCARDSITTYGANALNTYD